MKMKIFFLGLLMFVSFFIKSQEVKSIHLINYSNDKDLLELSSQLAEFAKKGINTLFLEVDYNYDFKSHPELRQSDSVITNEGAQYFTQLAKINGIKVIPQFQCLGHQSWKKNTGKLLEEYPEFDIMPGAFPNNDSIYCREWDVMNPKVNDIVFPLIDEIMEGFNAKDIHIGMDEVFLLGHPKSPSTKGVNPAYLYGKVVREFYDYFTKKKGKQLYMWGDRLIDGSRYNYGSWEASNNGTWLAVDSVPKDIIICDWHYSLRKTYPSVDWFLEKGFRVLTCSHQDVEAANSFISYSYSKRNSKMLGHMFTTWGVVPKSKILDFPAMNQGLITIDEGKFFSVFMESSGTNANGELLVKLTPSDTSLKIAYSLDGKDPILDSNIYFAPFVYPKNATVKAVPVKDGVCFGKISEADFVTHKAIGKKVILTTQPSIKYTKELKEKVLVNGVSFTGSFDDGEWLGFEGNDAEFVIDFEDTLKINKVSINFHNKVNSWVHHPTEVIVLGSTDSKSYSRIGGIMLRKTGRQILNVSIPVNENCSFLKVIAKNQIIPDGFNGAGNPAWIFLDEVEVY